MPICNDLMELAFMTGSLVWREISVEAVAVAAFIRPP
jgi:hypothetical protein